MNAENILATILRMETKLIELDRMLTECLATEPETP